MRNKTKKIFEKLDSIIPGGVNSPARACKGLLPFPIIVKKGKGDLIVDLDGNSYIDYCGSWGALIHGHANPTIVKAVQKRAALGTSFGITTPLEGELARLIIDCFPSVEKMRFVSSGTEATMSAVRLARGYTGKDIVIKFVGNYHGHADFFLVQAGSSVSQLSQSSSAGIPNDIVKHTFSLPYNDVKAFLHFVNDKNIKDRLAAVIVEPIAGNIGVVPASQDFLNTLRSETKRLKALLIFDEVITGFRVGLGGAQALYKITPDLTCFGKIIGGGFPAAGFGGRTDIMDTLAPLGTVYQAGTLSGNPVAMEAGIQAITLAQKNGFYQSLEKKTEIITKPLQALFKKRNIPACVQQVGSMFTLFFGVKEVRHFEDTKKFDLDQFKRFFVYLFDRGIYIPPSQYEAWFVSSGHTKQHLEKTHDLILQFFDEYS